MTKLLSTMVGLFCCTKFMFTQEIDLNQLKSKDRSAIVKEKPESVFKKNSLLLDVFAFSNFERFIKQPELYVTDASGNIIRSANSGLNGLKFDFNIPIGGQIEFFPIENWSAGLNVRNCKITYGFLSAERQVKTLNSQIIFNYHFPTGLTNSDISMGLGIGIYKESFSENTSYYSGKVFDYSTLIYSMKLNYRHIITKGLGVSTSLGTELYQYYYYYGSGSFIIGNTPFRVKPLISLGLFYKII